MLKRPCYILLICWGLLLANHLFSQQLHRTCGTAAALNDKFSANPSLKVHFDSLNAVLKNQTQLAIAPATTSQAARVNDVQQTVTIPVVIHIILPEPLVVTAAQIQSQIAVLNSDFAGTNGDASVLPSVFKPLQGKGSIQFCLARRTPDLRPTNGIDRKTANISFTLSNFEDVMKSSKGGRDAWNTNDYLNIWVVDFSGPPVGIGTFPGSSSANLQGVVVDYIAFGKGGSSRAPYNNGRTLTHELGHFFYLHHIWGDDSGDCSGSDEVDDTPNQEDNTIGCPDWPYPDACTGSDNGRLFFNYMDYTDDACMVMFTKEQIVRMEKTLDMFRGGLKSSMGCEPVISTAAVKFGVFRLRPTVISNGELLTLDILAEPAKIKFIQIVNMLGQIVYQKIVPGISTADSEIGIDRLFPGMYYILVGYDGGDQIKVQAEKFIKQ